MKRSTSAAFAPGVSVCGMISSLAWRRSAADAGRAPSRPSRAAVCGGGKGSVQRDRPAPARSALSCSTHNDAAVRRAARSKLVFSGIPSVRCGLSEISPLDLLGEVVGRAPRQREDRQRRVLLGRRRERRAVDDEQVLDLVHLVERVQRGALRIRTHAAGAVLVDRGAVAIEVAALVADEHAAGRLDDLLGGVAMCSAIFRSFSPMR